MNEYKRNTMVGGFMVVGVLLLATLIFVYGESPGWFGKVGYGLNIWMEGLSGAGEGSPVYMNGVQIGRVEQVRFRNLDRPALGVEIHALIEEEYVIPRNARAIVQPQGFGFGRGEIHIMIPAGPPAEPLAREGTAIPGDMAGALDSIVGKTLLDTLERTTAQIGDFAAKLTPAAEDLHNLFEAHDVSLVDLPLSDPQKLSANLYSAVQRFDGTLKNFNDVFGDQETKDNIKYSVANFRSMIDDGKEAAANLKETTAALQEDSTRITGKIEQLVERTDDRIDRASRTFIGTMEETSATMRSLNEVASSLAEGRGSAGLLLTDTKLYESLVVTLQEMVLALNDVRRLTKKWNEEGLTIRTANTLF